MPKIDVAALAWKGGSNYPEALRAAVEGRVRKRLGEAGGLTQFGVNLTRLPSGAASSHRHWHENEDECVFVLEGEVVLIEDEGEQVLRAGDVAAFKAGVPNGHHLVNRSAADAVYLEIGTRAATERAHYSDIDLAYVRDEAGSRFTRASGAPLD